MLNDHFMGTAMADTTVVTSKRSFSATTVDFLNQIINQLSEPGNSPWSDCFAELPMQLKRIVAEAGFMGFPRAARLGRAIYNAVPHVQKDPSTQSSLALVETLRLLLMQCRSGKENVQTDTESAIALLQAALSVDRATLLTPLRGYEQADRCLASNPNADSGLASVGHHDASIYSNAVIDSLDRCAEEESWTVAQLASVAEDLACNTEKMRPAHRLMSVLRGHRFFRNVDRLCLVGLVRGSNQLIVVDSCVSQRLRSYRDDNPMVRGYSCFVNPQGSLFRMKPGVLRVFDDCGRVLESFARQGKPAQRSIAHIADTGLRSGLCLAIGRGEAVQGFLFMNSQQVDMFRDVTTRFAPLLSLFSLLGTVAFDAAGFHADRGEIIDGHLPKHSVEFCDEKFVEMVTKTVNLNAELQVNLSIRKLDTPRFLYLPRTIVGVVADLIEKTDQRKGQEIKLTVKQVGEQIEIGWEHGREKDCEVCAGYLERATELCQAKYTECPVSIAILGETMSVRFPAEPVFECVGGCAYSVAY